MTGLDHDNLTTPPPAESMNLVGAGAGVHESESVPKSGQNAPGSDEDLYENPDEICLDPLEAETTEQRQNQGQGVEELVAICDFNSSMPNDLSFKRGDRFTILSASSPDSSWCLVRDEDNNISGNVPLNYLAHSDSLFVHDWYHGNISAAEAIERLTSRGNSAGSYLIRQNGPRHTLMILTEVEGQNRLETLQREIEQNSDGKYQMHPLELTFSNIVELVIHCKMDKPDLGQPLGKACRRMPPTLLDLCSDHQERLNIPAADFKKEWKLAKGNFANVWQGRWRNKIVVALKELIYGRWSDDQISRSIAVMRKLQHPNIVRLYGVCEFGVCLVLVTEFLEHGSLRDYLRSEEGSSASFQDVLNFAKQTACGVAYLEAKGVVHRDLAAKNVLLGANKTVKVADCGLVRAADDVYVEEGDTFAYRWSAPEVILKSKYSTKSDVWAFAILLVELTTHGQLPYKDLSVSEVVSGACNGVMHERPTKCPPDLYLIMTSCWALKDIARPNFQSIITELDTLIGKESDMLSTATIGHDHRQNKTGFTGGSIVLALFNYTAKSEDEMSFSRGDSLELIGQTSDRVAEQVTSTYINTSWDAWRLARHLGSGEKGFIPYNYVTRDADVIPDDWYHPDLTGAEAVVILNAKGAAPGTFLIRKSGSQARFVLCVKDDNDTVQQYRITEKNCRVQIEEGVLFNDLHSLIRYYSDNPGLCCQLSVVCRVQRPALQELSPGNLRRDGFEMDRATLLMETDLAEGKFGKVWKGLAHGAVPVAIKQSKPNIMSREDFMREATIMKKLDHPSLVRLYGVCSDEPILIVTEFAENGSLLKYLRQDEGPEYRISQTAMIFIAQQVAAGMVYLAERGYIHRDLAARNVLVFNNHQVKIADFGLARAIPEAVYTSHSKEMPIQWTAPEGLRKRKFSVQSDVWSFGILLVEIFSHGGIPYPGRTNEEVMRYVENGGCPEQPKPECPDDIYQSMQQCWDRVPEERPSFSKLSAELDTNLRKAAPTVYNQFDNNAD